MLKRLFLLFVSIILLVSVFSFITPNINIAHANTTNDFCLDSEEQLFLQLINDYRNQNSLPSLVASQTLGAAAEHHSIDMATWNYFSHTLYGDPNTSFDDVTWAENIYNHGYTTNGGYRGENIAAGNQSASRTFTQWKNSSTHNAAMLSSNFKAIGIGQAYGANSTYKWYWTTTFGGYVDGSSVICGGNISPTPTSILIPTNTPTPIPGVTATITPTEIPTPTNTPVPTSTPVPTNTPSPTPGTIDAIPPTVSITSPLNNSIVAKRSKVAIIASAYDNIGVIKVDFLVNGTLKCSSLLPPYSCVWKVPSGKTTNYTIEAKAYDAGGNTATSTVTVIAR